jgi:hypothetical protein
VTISLGLLGVGIAILWASALVSSATRNWLFLSFLGLASIVAIGGATYGGTIGTIVEVGVLAIAIAAVLWPARFRLSSLTHADTVADDMLRSLDQTLDNQGGPRDASPYVSALNAEPFASPSGPWANVGSLYRLILARSGETDPETRVAGATPIWAYRQAGRDYRRAALSRRVIGSRSGPSPWDEDVLLRCFSEQLDRIIPKVALANEPVVPQGGWNLAARRLVDEVRDKRLRHPTSIEMRRLLADAMSAELTLALGDRSRSAIDRGNAAAAALKERWPALAAAAAVTAERSSAG